MTTKESLFYIKLGLTIYKRVMLKILFITLLDHNGTIQECLLKNN